MHVDEAGQAKQVTAVFAIFVQSGIEAADESYSVLIPGDHVVPVDHGGVGSERGEQLGSNLAHG